MAGDWIKMRVTIDRDPKVIDMALRLSENPEFVRWAVDGVTRDRHANVTLEAHDARVTRVLIRDAVVTALLRVWGAALERGKRDGQSNDLLLSHCQRVAIDEIGGIPGIADAMEHVGFVRFGDTAVFPNLLEDNIPACERDEARKREQSRVRSRRHREKKHDAVTQSSCTNHATSSIEESSVVLSVASATDAPPAPPPEAQAEIDWLVEESRFIAAWNACEGVVLHRQNAFDTNLGRSFRDRYAEPGWLEHAAQAMRKFPLQNGAKISIRKFLEPTTVDEILGGIHDFTRGQRTGANRLGPGQKYDPATADVEAVF